MSILLKKTRSIFMARKLRQWYPNACYHVTSRGNRRSDIFRDKADFRLYLKILSLAIQAFQETPYDLICYCLMSNHVHLIIQTSTEPLAPLMKKINMNYAIYFNRKYNYTGHLYQGRYHADTIENINQLLIVSRYIHLNPVAANIVKFPEDYTYSSYRVFVGLSRCEMVNKQKVLSKFKNGCASKLYKEFVGGQTPNNSEYL